jgi:hypothetical protein
MGLLKGCLAKGLIKLTRIPKGLPRLPKVVGWLQDIVVFFLDATFSKVHILILKWTKAFKSQ